jgi:integrase
MYLTRRGNIWLLDLTFPFDYQFDELTKEFFGGRRHFTKSMRTADRDQAEIRALPYVQRFKVALYIWKNRRRATEQNVFPTVWLPRWPDGHHQVGPYDLHVKGDKVTYLQDGDLVKVDENPKVMHVNAVDVEDQDTADALVAIQENTLLPRRFAKLLKTPDDAILETYLTGKREALKADARGILKLYKEVVGKPLLKATPSDARDLAEVLSKRGNSKATIQKRLGWLSAAINHAISMRKFDAANPFVSAARKGLGKAEVRRAEWSEEHMRLCWENLHRLDAEDQLLWKVLAVSGARLGEVCSINKEDVERGTDIRFCWVGTKTKASYRRLPLPDGLGLPAQIRGPLFQRPARVASKRLNRFIKKTIRDCPGLDVHGLRHRAIDVFRNSKTDAHLRRRRLVGHASADVHDQYGGNHPPLQLLKPMYETNPIDGTFRL